MIQPDDAKAVETRPAGENIIVVESEQAGGGWGFSLRLIDENGKPHIPASE